MEGTWTTVMVFVNFSELSSHLERIQPYCTVALQYGGVTMSVAIATFEKVQLAVEELQRIGQKPTISRVKEHIGGGSRSTILPHMQKLFAQMASAKPQSRIAESFLTKQATTLVESVWDQAVEMAVSEMEQRIRSLMDINAGIAAGTQELLAENEALTKALQIAEARVLELETALSTRDEFESHLSELSKVVHKLRDEAPLEPDMFAVMVSLSETPVPPGRKELLRRMIAKGYDAKAASLARSHCVYDGYVEERGTPPRQHLTQKGHARLAKEKQRSA